MSDVVAAGPEYAVTRMADRRWFHGLDKAYGGHAASPDGELGEAFAAWTAEVRCHPAVVAHLAELRALIRQFG
ncbi:hypothetical protein GCM10011608_14570 [Micromonospora sonchi]|uniref:Uncharacterized protein n=1 Tax=Micromonospora sonchi TaxID=1763543 RepID=A0A917TNU9_9ACTN|nr:hypothetical protein [Micromonospora sonchi]GGM31073.1 hypothetical protein GCM10011608_14570 [Micromonospora sonchi]